MDTAIFQEIGLTKNETKVYLTLLELGSTSAGPLIKNVGMHRAAVYNLLDLLISKGLVSYVMQANRKYFQAQDPECLVEYIEMKRRELETKENELKRLLPELQKKRKLITEEQEGTIYKGKKGLKSILEDILKTKSPFLVFGATGQFKELFGAYFIHFHNRRAKANISLKIIYNEHLRVQQRERELSKAEIHYLPKEYITPSTTYIWSNSVAVIQWSSEPMAFVIKSKSIADSYKSFFNVLWKSASP
ncbi:hypothetical protein J4421_00325 [Candidatus Woesearchaeota archaeon]|nr:hypothetical protein [Candidatus Woesearchaeota archaeon]